METEIRTSPEPAIGGALMGRDAGIPGGHEVYETLIRLKPSGNATQVTTLRIHSVTQSETC